MTSILGGLPPAKFLRRHWQKRPLLIRQAFPGFQGFLDRDSLLALAHRGDAVSRLVLQHPRRRSRWERHDGPFEDLSHLPKSHWTVLVHGVESLVPGGWELLGAFSFLPAARIDDLMVSYASDGGGVGPHVDAYDVFLLQGPGRRRWQISRQAEHLYDPDAAIKVLKNFVPEEEYLLESGDMLYLPPGVAHLGVAEGECLTYSVGFLAPSHETLVQSFLGYLGEKISAEGLYGDPDLQPPKHPLEVGNEMVGKVAKVLSRIRWSDADVGEFLGRYLTGSRPQTFLPPRRPLSLDAFARRVRRVRLALPTRGLLRGRMIFLNGEGHIVSRATARLFAELVANRSLTLPRSIDAHAIELLHGWYLAGYLTDWKRRESPSTAAPG